MKFKLREGLEGKKVIIKDKDSIYYNEWGTVMYDDFDEIGVAIADDRNNVPIFSRKDLKIMRKTNN